MKILKNLFFAFALGVLSISAVYAMYAMCVAYAAYADKIAICYNL